jgi:hypothetical protein
MADVLVSLSQQSTFFVPDFLTPSQWSDMRESAMSPELRLMHAVLEDAVNRWLKLRPIKTRSADNIRKELRAWFESRSCLWLYSFQNICDIFNLDSDAIWKGLNEQNLTPRGERLRVTGYRYPILT